ncbi:hypothetical protein [Endozoicomonas acroporae]|uniref:hypothetical protein n=1 Tax=Endozoicomonas acroporae TaxID=1701104 RepID=UPI003D7A1A43
MDTLQHGVPSAVEVVTYEQQVDPVWTVSLIGHVSNIKGIVFEQLYVDQLAGQGIEAGLFEATNHPGTDIWGEVASGDVVEFQLKATDSVSYINATLAENPEFAIVTTSEVADSVGEAVIDSGIEDSVLETAVTDTLFDEVVNPVSPFSVLGWLFGLPF